MWVESNMGDGKPMSVRTFHQHRKVIEELFGLEIKCNVYDNYRYYLDSPEKLRNDRTRRWLFNSFSLSNLIAAGHNMNGRILFENIPRGTEYLQPVVEAMQRNKVLEIYYQPFDGHLATYHVEPYAMKVYHQRWYVIGKLKEKDEIRQISLDRINDLQLTDESFTVPRSFNAEQYYANTVGIFVNEELKPQKIRIRVYGNQVEYLRSLPLHKSQQEILTRYNEFSDFQLKSLSDTRSINSTFGYR